MPAPTLTIRFIKQSALWDKHRGLRQAIKNNLATLWPKLSKQSAKLLIVLSDDATVQRLNKQFRNKDKPTNVLSFDDSTGEHLGQIVLSYETIFNESIAEEIPFRQYVTYLTLHGTLHILGYDHDTQKNAKTMENLEIKLLKTIGLPNPYQDRVLVA